MLGLMSMVVPLPYRIMAIALLIAAVGGYGYYKGHENGFNKGEIALQKYVIEASQKYIRLESKKNEVTEKVVVEYVDRVKEVIKWRTKNVYQAIEVVPDTGILSNGWVQVHDSSARSSDADSTGAADATPSGISSTEALSGVVDNYGICYENSERLIALQTWITEQKKLVDEANKKNGRER